MEDVGAGRSREAWLLAALGALPFVGLAAWHWNVPPSADSSDYAQYIQHARALLDGRPYTDTGYLRSELNRMLGPRALPPGLPLTLMPLVALFGAALAPMKGLMIVSAVLFLVLAAVRIGWTTSRVAAVAGAAFAGIVLEARYATSAPITDPGFAALLWATFLVADRPGRWTKGRAISVLALGAALMAYRLVGVAIVPAVALLAFSRKREERGPMIAVLAGWIVLGGVAAVAVLGGLPLLDLLGPRGVPVLVRFLRHMAHYPQLVQEVFLYPFPGNLANDVYHVGASVVAMAGAVVVARRERLTLMSSFVVAYMALLFLAPAKEARYVWPLYPLLAACFVEGMVVGLGRFVPSLRAARLAAISAILLMLGGVLAVLRQPDPDSLQGADTARLFDVLRAEKARGTVRVMYANPRVLALEVGVPSMGLAAARDNPTMLRALARGQLTHLVQGEVGGLQSGQGPLAALVGAYPDAFELRLHNATYSLYRIRYIPPDTIPPPRGPGR